MIVWGTWKKVTQQIYQVFGTCVDIVSVTHHKDGNGHSVF